MSISHEDQQQQLSGMEPLPGLSDTDLKIVSYLEDVERQRESAAALAGNIAMARSIQDQVWSRHVREVVEPNGRILQETVDFLATQPQMEIRHIPYFKNGTGKLAGQWKFDLLRHIDGKDLHLGTTVALFPSDVADKGGLARAVAIMRDPNYREFKNTPVLGIEPQKLPLSQTWLQSRPKYKYEYMQKDTIRQRAIEEIIRNPGLLWAVTRVNVVGDRQSEILHDTGLIEVRWTDTDQEQTRSPFSFRSGDAEIIMIRRAGTTDFDELTAYFKDRAAEESHAGAFAVLAEINSILHASNAVTP